MEFIVCLLSFVKSSIKLFARLFSILVVFVLLGGQLAYAVAELKCPNGKLIGTNFTTSDFLVTGATCPNADDKGYLDSSAGGISGNTFGSLMKLSCAIHVNASISGITMSSPTSCSSGSTDLANKYVLVQDADGTYYSVLHKAYNDWNGGTTLIAQECDPTGIFDSSTGCSGGTTGSCTAIASCPSTSQTISFTPPASGTYGSNATLSATATPSGLTVIFTSATTGVCTVSGTTVNYIGVGTCTINANQPGDATYSLATQVFGNIIVAKANQTIAFSPPTNGTNGSSTTLSATATPSGLTVIFTSATTGVCTVSGTTVNYIGVGICTINADQAGDANYNAASQISGNITVTNPPPPSPPSTPSYSVITQVAGTGTGSIAQTNVAVSSGQTAKIQLTAIPTTGSKFIGWSNSFAPECVGTSPDVTVTVNAIKTCIATFEIIKQSGFRSSIMDTGALDFGTIPIAISRSFTISENGNIDLIVSNPTFTGANATDFIITSPQFPLTIPDGAPAQIIAVQCKPTGEGTRTASLQLTTNDPQNPTVQYLLSCGATSLDIGGAVTVPTAKYSSTPVVNQVITFGTALIGQVLSSNIAISELGNAPLNVTFKDLIGPNSNDFKVISGLPVTIPDGGAAQNVQVQCMPSDTGVRVGVLQFTTNDVYQTMASYMLVCTGESPAAPVYILTLNTTGSGVIDNCGAQCTQPHTVNSTVTLTTTPAAGWQFHEWTGDCTSNGQMEMTHDKTCTANFVSIATTPGTTTPGTTIPGTTIPGTTIPGTTTPSTPTTGTPTAPTNNGLVTESTTNYGQTATNLTIGSNGSVAGGTLAGTTVNNGLVANVAIANNATLTGGKLSGFNTNLGMLQDVTVSQYAQVQGGNYAGTIINNGTLINPLLSPSSSVINHGVLENPVILPGANVTGGKLTGSIIVLGTYDNVEIPPSAKVITQTKAIPLELFQQLNAQTLALLPASVLSQVTPEQFAQIPVAALSGFTAENMGAVSPQVAQSLDAEHIAALDPETFKAMPSDSVAKLLTNFDTQAITPQEAEKLLPKGWTIDANGNLTTPPGSKIAAKSLNLSQLPAAGITLPNMTDLNSSFALGGKGTKPLTNQLNQASKTAGVTVTQQQTGVVHADVAGSAGYGQKSKFAFMIDPNNLFILDENALRGLQINEQGQYVIVTEDGKQIPITPMTQDPEALLTVLGDNVTVDIRPTGEVLIKHKPIKRSRDGEEVYSIGMFDPFIEPAPEDICTPDGCNWDQADAWMQPGLRSGKNLRAKAAAKVIYPDGTSQQLYPTVLSPDILVEEGKKFKGVEKMIFRMDGTFAVTYQGTKILLIPEFDAQMQPIPAGKKFKPSLTLQPNGKLLYQVPYLDQLFSTRLSIAETPTS